MPPFGHPGRQPLLGAANGFRVDRTHQIAGEPPASAERLCRRQKPGFELPFRQHDTDRQVGASLAGAPQKLPAESCRAFVVTVQKNEDASHWSDASGDDLNRPLELTREDQLVLGNPDRGIQMYHELRIDLLSYSPDQNRYGLDLSVTLDDTTYFQAHPA